MSAALDPVALVALVISLVALVVATGQFLIELFATADGYRRCGSSAIGVWSKGRKREFLPYEWRFDVSYTMPEIVLLTPLELEKAEEDYDHVYPLHCYRPHDTSLEREMLSKTMHPVPTAHPKRNLTGLSSPLIPETDPEKVLSSLPPKKSPTRRNRPARKANQMPVSWLRLLESLHILYTSYWPGDCQHDDCRGRGNQHAATADTATYESLSRMKEFRRSRNDAVVIYRQWSWDFMPPDIVRPLAQTNVRDIIILAQRLGMQWSALDPLNGKMQADGNGYNLSGVDVRGLGIVLKLIGSGNRGEFTDIIPSRAVDKMMFGIVPGDPKLVKRDFELIDDRLQVGSITSDEGIFSWLGIDEDRRKLVGRKPKGVTHGNKNNLLYNDSIMLLCPFLPLSGQPHMRIHFPAWAINMRGTVFHMWESRVALFRGLKKRLDDLAEKPVILLKVQEFLNTMQRDYSHTFWSARWNRPAYVDPNLSRQDRSKMIDLCRAAFDYTTETLVRIPFQFGDKDDIDRPRYFHLVAAYLCMATKALDLGEVEYQAHEKEKPKISQVAIREEFDVTDKKYCAKIFQYPYYLYARNYTELYSDKENGIGAYLKEQNIDLSDTEVDEAFWLLVLRGITWNMAIAQVSSLGNRIPSSFYTNKTPLWIT